MRSCGSKLPTRMPCSKSIHSRRNASPVGSSPVRFSAFASGSQSLVDGGRCKNALEDLATVFAAEDGFAGAFGVRHEAEDVACLVANAGDVVDGPVGVLAVTEQHSVLAPELLDYRRLGEIAAFAVGNRQPQ